MSTFNYAAADTALKHIEANPDLWLQDGWVTQTDCGTAYCFAGWALTLAGVRICDEPCDGPDYCHVVHVHLSDMPWYLQERVSYRARGRILPHDVDGTSDMYTVSEVARALLGATFLQSIELFCPSNDLNKLRDLVDEYALDGD